MSSDANGEKTGGNSVSNDDTMQRFISAVVESFDIELARFTSEEDQVKILDEFNGLYGATKWYSFFTPVSLKNWSEEFFTHDLRRNFMLNLVERVSISMAVKRLAYDDRLIDLLTRHVTVAKTNPESGYSLINKEVLESLYMGQDVVKAMFKDNFWLAVLYLLLVHFQLSAFFKVAVEPAKPN